MYAGYNTCMRNEKTERKYIQPAVISLKTIRFCFEPRGVRGISDTFQTSAASVD